VPPVKMSVSKLARDGRVILKFNQDMIVPKFIKDIDGQGQRRLGTGGPASMDEINMAKIFGISIGVMSDAE